MSSQFARVAVLFAGFSVTLIAAAVSSAQGTNPNFQVGKEQQQEMNQQLEEKQLSKVSNPPPVKVDPKEEAAYKAFFNTPQQDVEKKIQLGQDFVQRYPSSVYAEAVHSAVAKAYYTKQDWKDFFSESDKALALNHDDVDMLTMVGWVIPHTVTESEPDADAQLDKAEADEKHAVDIIGTMPKPATMTDDQFAALKTAKLAEAHSGLGLTYFRRHDYDKSAKELQQATEGNPNPDPLDLFALGASLQNSGHYNDASDAFNRCAQMAGSLQAPCKQNADNAKKLAAQQK